MGKYLRPRRGNENEAIDANIKLWKGEIFMEYPEGRGIGKSAGRIVIGNGEDTYSEKVNVTTDPHVFQPFITDPSIYVPLHEDSAPEQDYKYDDEDRGTTIAGRWITGVRALPTIIGYIKGILCEHIDNLKYDDYRIKLLRSNVDDNNDKIADLYLKVSINSSNISKNTTAIENLSTYVTDTYVTKNIFNSSTSSINTRLNNISITNIKFWHANIDGYFYDYNLNRGPACHDAAGMITVTFKNSNGSTYEVNSYIAPSTNNYFGLCSPSTKTSITNLNNSVSQLNTRVNNNDISINNLNLICNGLDGKISEVFDNLNHDLNEYIASNDNRVNNLDDRVSALERK